jgi:hypothetical protein
MWDGVCYATTMSRRTRRRRGRLGLAGWIVLAACGSSDPTGDTDGETDTSGSSTDVQTSSTEGSGTASTSSTTTDASTTAEASTGTVDVTSDGTTGDEGTTGTPQEPGCPDDLPENWVLCEDFEEEGGPETYFATFWTEQELVGVEAAPEAWSGARALRIGHDPAVFASGVADIRFGQGPGGGLIHAPDEEFREIWVRFHLRTQPGWPDAGIAEAIDIMSLFGNSRAIALDATIYSPTQAQARPIAWSCIHNSQLLCNGQGDWSNPNLEARQVGLGTSALYGSEAAGRWQCHEVHVRLDDPGQGNGEFEVFVDDALEVSLDGITFVDAWTGAALNTLRFSSFWNAPAALDHWVDDVVVSTAPIGCPDL